MPATAAPRPAQPSGQPPTPSPSQPTASEERNAYVAVTVFPLLILAAAAIGVLLPEPVSEVRPYTSILLGVIMFGMGLTLTVSDIALVFTRPLPIVLGVVAQYAIMPLLGFAVAWALRLPPELAVGVILVGCAPGGTASNVISYLAKADTALSVAMTTASTLLAPLLTPLLTLWLAGRYMAVDVWDMARSILLIVLVPVLAGLVLRLALPRVVDAALPVLPWLSVVTISVVVAGLVAGSAEAVVSAGLTVLFAVVLHNGLGYALGYGAAALFRLPVRSRRTVSIEVGMQNSGLAAGLAAQYFEPASALPGAVFSVWHNVSGAVLAAIYRRRSRG